jgi:hypothetical protein
LDEVTYFADYDNDLALGPNDIKIALESIDWQDGDYNLDGIVDNQDRNLMNRFHELDRQYRNIANPVTFHRWDCIGGGFQATIDNNIDQEQFALDFNGDGFVNEQMWKYFYYSIDFEDEVFDTAKVDSNYDDMEALICAAVQELEPSTILQRRMDLNGDNIIDWMDVDLGIEALDFLMFDYGGNGRLNEGELFHFTDWESAFSRWRRNGDPIDFDRGDLNCNGIADQGDVDIFLQYWEG